MLKTSNLEALKGVRHGFFTRRGGVSPSGGGDMDGLNCGFGSDDAPDNVARNRDLAMQRLGAAKRGLVTAFQVHSAVAVRVCEPWQRESAPHADALASSGTGLALGILTADCAPVLFVDPKARVIGAAHAGWRGALAGVLESCVAEMTLLGASAANISAAVGPCIAQPSYEVGADFQRDFLKADAASDCLFAPAERPGHFLFDLSGYVERRLEKLGLASVEGLGVDTCADADRFYSYRRCTLNGEKDYGRLLSAIVLEQTDQKD